MDEEKPEMESNTGEVVSDGISDARAKVEKVYYERELRSLQLKAYSGVLEALRASGRPNPEKDGIIKTLRDYFSVSEERHKSELRVIAFDEKLSLISEKIAGRDFSGEWAFDAQPKYVPFSEPTFSVYCTYPPSLTSNLQTIRNPKPNKINRSISNTFDNDSDSTDSDIHSETELELIESLIKTHPGFVNGLVVPERQKSVKIAVEPGTGNEEEIEEMEQQIKKRLIKGKKGNQATSKSPDITDAPKTPTNSKGDTQLKGKSRGVKRKESTECNVLPVNNDLELSTPSSTKKFSGANSSSTQQNRQKLKKGNRNRAKIKFSRSNLVRPPSAGDNPKAKSSSEETSSADEGENGPLPLDSSSRVMSPVFSEVIRASVLNRQGGSVNKNQLKRSSSATAACGGVDRRKNQVIVNSSVKLKGGKSRPRTPNQKGSKFKNSVPTGGSRRKSKLNEKLDYDDVLMDLDGNEMMEQQQHNNHHGHHHHQNFVYASGSSMDEVPRRLMLDPESLKEYRSAAAEDQLALYSESLPINYNYNHEDMEQVTDGVFKRPLPPSKGPKAWELKDATRQQRDELGGSDENNGNSLHYSTAQEMEHSQQLSPDGVSEGSPSKKQRLKSPLVVNPNINPGNKVGLAPPVFSTSLSATKKRQKGVSVVDSLNLHLPTVPTASSLACSSNNRRTGQGSGAGGGCSMFSNSSALIAGARGTAPGILQQQRKAQPHILANSKVHQRAAFSPAAASAATGSSSNNGSSNASSGGNSNNASAPISVTPSFTAMPATSPVQDQVGNQSGIPIPVAPSSPIPISFQQAGNSNSVGGIPIGRQGPQGPNIIFVQKSNGPGVSVGSPVPNNLISIRPQHQQRAVILRRTPMPRQSNVMFLDMPKNEQAPPFLQTARILNAPGELSLLNLPSSSPIKVSPAGTSGGGETTIEQKPGGIVIQTTNPEAFLASLSNQLNHHHQQHQQHFQNQVVTSSESEPQQINENEEAAVAAENGEELEGGQEDQPEGEDDAQYAQIEAELMQMEEGGSFEEVVYEEEVTTEIVPLEDDGGNTQYIYTNECPTTTTEISSQHNVSTVSAASGGSSTDTASEAETSIQLNSESPDKDSEKAIKKVCLSPGVQEMRIASDAITRALSLSRTSPVKNLTFSTPVTIQPSVTFNMTSCSDKLITTECITVPIHSTEEGVTAPIVFQTGEAENDEGNVNDTDLSSTNNLHCDETSIASPETIEVAIHQTNDCEPPVQENTSAS